jgi:hypothetical protein
MRGSFGCCWPAVRIGRDEVMGLLRQRASERGDLPPAAVQVQRIDERNYAVHSDGPEP